MNYELAKKLKEAGFPQLLKYGDWYFENIKSEGDEVVCNLHHGEDISLNLVKCPTLSELIGACGWHFHSLWDAEEDAFGHKRWGAKPKWDSRKMVETENHEVFGKTPEEAVANLWLELNKK